MNNLAGIVVHELKTQYPFILEWMLKERNVEVRLGNDDPTNHLSCITDWFVNGF